MKHFHLKLMLSTIFCFILFSSTGQQLNSSFALGNNDETIHKVETSSNLSTDNAGTLQHESSETSEGEGAHGESEGLSTLPTDYINGSIGSCFSLCEHTLHSSALHHWSHDTCDNYVDSTSDRRVFLSCSQ